METLENYSATVSTNCHCGTYWDDELQQEVETANCFGDCGDWMLEGWNETANEFLKRNDEPNAVIIHGRNMTWLRRSGYAIAQGTAKHSLAEAMLNKLTLNGDFTIEAKLEGNTLTIQRYSHDEPMGASFVIEPVELCQGWSDCQEFENLQELEGVKFCPYCLDIELANR